MKLIALLCSALLCTVATAADRPNIVLIFIDDMGWTDTTYNGSDLYETPHIDELAAAGMKFTNAYASAGNCEPSRACLISGQYTPRHHMYAVSSTGESLVPVMTGSRPLQRKSVFWHFPGYLDGPNPGSRDNIFRARPVTVIRKGDWKLHLFHEEWSLDGGRGAIDDNKSVELYNLADDISEQTDLASSDKAMRVELLDELLAWKESTGAKFAHQANPDYDPDAPVKKRRRKKK